MNATILRKYGAFVRIAAAQARRGRGELVGRVVFFAVVLGVFSSLWRAAAEAGMSVAADPKALVWYLAITEWIVLSAPAIHVDVQEAVRRGDVVCQLSRPVSYVGAAFAEGMGALIVRAPVLFMTACVCAFAFTGWIPSLRVLMVVLPLGFAAAALTVALYLGIGLLAFWLGDVLPVSWVWQKLMFIFGGLMMPLEFYPSAIRRMAVFTPFPTVLTEPASLILRGSVAGTGSVAFSLTLWSCITSLLLYGIFRRVSATLTVNGG
jgi:viologen exporter family transport system permease protein